LQFLRKQRGATLTRIGAATIVFAMASACGGGGGSSGGTTGSVAGSLTSLVTGAPMAQVSITLSGTASQTTTTDGNGAYSFSALAPGTYTVRPNIPGATLSPTQRSVTVAGAVASGEDFTAIGGAAIASQIKFLPDGFSSADQLRAAVVVAGDAVFFTDSSDFPLKKVSRSTGAVTPLAARLRNAESVVLYGQDVYWVDGGTLNVSSIDGKTTRVLARGNRVLSYGGTPAVIVDGTYAYWVSDLVSTDCSSCAWVIQRVPLGGGAPVTLATSNRLVVALAADADHLYWEEAMLEPVAPGCACGTTIHSIPKAGGASLQIVDGLLNAPPPVLPPGYTQGSWLPAGGIAVTPSAVIFANSAGPYQVNSVPLTGGTVTTLASVPTTAGEGLNTIRNLSVAGTNVYWLDPTNATLDSVPLAGGAVTTLVSGIDVPNQSPVALAVNATTALWSEAGAYGGCCLVVGAGMLKQVALSGGTVKVVASGLDAPTAVAANDTTVAWTEAWRVAAAPIAGGAPVTVASGIASDMARITTDGTTIYVLDGDYIKTLPVAGGTVGKLAAAHGGSITDLSDENQDLVTDGASVFWTTGVGEPVVQKVALSGGTPVVLSAGTISAGQQECYWRIALAGGHVYWSAGSAQPTSTGCRINRVPVDGGVTSTIIDVPFMRDFAVDDSNIYYSQLTTPSGTIQRIPVTGGTPTGVAGDVIAWVLISDANRLYWMDPKNGGYLAMRKADAGTNNVLNVPVPIASDPMLAAEGMAVGPDGLYATSTESGDLLWLF
jgi:hypothetical protein